jgi:hypothetical protein
MEIANQREFSFYATIERIVKMRVGVPANLTHKAPRGRFLRYGWATIGWAASNLVPIVVMRCGAVDARHPFAVNGIVVLESVGGVGGGE